jgi:dTDP-4-amino-4,6-dideoxygalactose transaminase
METNISHYFDFADLLSILGAVSFDHRTLLEKEFANYIGVKKAIATSFGRTALLLGLKAMGVKDKEVIIPSFNCTVVRNAVTLAGANPCFVDIHPSKFTYDLDQLKCNITSRTAAILLIHYFGRVARNIGDIVDFANSFGIPLIEDCAHSLGASYNGCKIGNFGRFAIFSLTKNTMNFGGGIMVTSDPELFRRAQAIMEQERVTLNQKVFDFPRIFSYGLEQGINKLIFDRPKKSLFKYWAVVLPRSILKARQYISTIRSNIIYAMQPRRNRTGSLEEVSENNERKDRNNLTLHMANLIAGLGRSQLRKIDVLNDQRRKICNSLSRLDNALLPSAKGMHDVCTHFVMRFPERDIFQVIREFKKFGLLLRATWPTHQRLWPYQETSNVIKIKNEILTYDVNPMLTDREIAKFIRISQA